MSTIINLSYFEYDDTFYFINIKNLDPQYFTDFMGFYLDIINGVNIPNPNRNTGLVFTAGENGGGTVSVEEIGAVGDPIGYYSKDSGEGAFPFTQSMELSNIVAENVLTKFDANTTYDFDIEVQNQTYQFNALGSALETWQDVIDLVTANSPAEVIYYPTNAQVSPKMRFQSNVEGQLSETLGGPAGQLVTVQSQIDVRKIANIVNNSGEKTSTAVKARIDLLLIEPTASHVLTRVPSNDSTVFQFAIGKRKNLVVRGFQARTYQDLVDTIQKFEGVNCLYRLDGEKKHIVTLYVPLPKTPKTSQLVSGPTELDPLIITRNATLTGSLNTYASSANALNIEDFSGLTTNSKIIHDLKSSVYGGYSLLSVIQNSKRSNGSYWTEVVAIENDKLTPQAVSAKIPEHKVLLDDIDTQVDNTEGMTPDVKRKMSIDLGGLISILGPLLEGVSASKSDLLLAAGTRIAGLIASYFPRPANITPPDPTIPAAAQETIIDDGYAVGALDPVTGEVANASLLTPAQKAKLVPPDRTTVD